MPHKATEGSHFGSKEPDQYGSNCHNMVPDQGLRLEGNLSRTLLMRPVSANCTVKYSREVGKNILTVEIVGRATS